MLPDIYIFNPTCEMAVGNGTNSFQANTRLQKFEEDLDLLPLPFARSTDYLLVNQLPSQKFQKQFELAGWQIPTFSLVDDITKDQTLRSCPKGFLEPWGWSPVMHNKLKPLKDTCSATFKQLPNAEWNPKHRQLYCRETAQQLLQEVSVKLKPSNLMINETMHPIVCHSEAEVHDLLNKWGRIVMKAPWSSSGRGIQMVEREGWKSFHGQWTHGTIQRHGKIMVEPFLNKIADLAFQFHIDEHKQVHFLGVSWFQTNSNGQYELNFINQMPPGLSTEAKDFFHCYKNSFVKAIHESIQSSRLVNDYYGYLGIDALLILDDYNEIKIHPCLEINLRYNMGTLAIKLGELIHPKSKGEFHIYFEPGTSYNEFCKIQKEAHPVQYADGKFKNGFIPLTEPSESRMFGAWMRLD